MPSLPLTCLIRARAETEHLTLQAFLRPGGELPLFRGSARAIWSPSAPLSWMASYLLVDSPSKLVVLKQDESLTVGIRL